MTLPLTLIAALAAIVRPAAPGPLSPPTEEASAGSLGDLGSDSCNRVLDLASSVRNRGRRLGLFVDRIKPGETGCLRAGFYPAPVGAGRNRELQIDTPRVKLRSFPGERARIKGRIWVKASAELTVIARLDLDGRNRRMLPSPTINAPGVTFRYTDISNQNTEICFLLGGKRYGAANRTRLIRNRIHNCGELPATNADHGIYVARSRGSVIAKNVIVHNADRGVQLYPAANDTLVKDNVIIGNGTGVIVSGNAGNASSHNKIVGNLTGMSRIAAIDTHWPGPVGRHNVAARNCLFGKTRGPSGTGGRVSKPRGLRLKDNVRVDPRGEPRRSTKPSMPRRAEAAYGRTRSA